MKTTRYTIDLDPTLDQVLTALAEEKGTNKADVIRRALASYRYLATQSSDGQLKVSLTNNADEVIKDVVLP